MYTKVSSLSAFTSVRKSDIICLSENYLNSGTSSDDDNLKYLDIITFAKITHLTVNKEEFVFTIGTSYLRELLV